jgi:hypothetical protein
MLSADKNVTLTEFQIQTLQIREKELNYFVNLYNSISGKWNVWWIEWSRIVKWRWVEIFKLLIPFQCTLKGGKEETNLNALMRKVYSKYKAKFHFYDYSMDQLNSLELKLLVK